VLVVAQTGEATGFGRIARHIAAAVGVEGPVDLFGAGPGAGWRAHDPPASDPWRVGSAAAVVEGVRPRAVIVVGTASFTDNLLRVAEPHPRARLVAYVPVEGHLRGGGDRDGLRRADAIVAYQEEGARELRALLPDGPAVQVVPHPTLVGAPVTGMSRAEARRGLFPDVGDRADGLWVLNANRNDSRKDLACTMRVFAHAARESPDASLVLRGAAWSRAGGSLVDLAERLGLAGRVLFARRAAPAPGAWTDEHMATLYRCCEIGVNTARGEAWGMASFEHAALGAAQAVPGHATLRETWAGAPTWLPLGGSVAIDRRTEGHAVDERQAAHALRRLLTDAAAREGVASACRARATAAALTPAAVAARWRGVVRALGV